MNATLLNHAVNAGGTKLDPRKVKFPYTVGCGNVRLKLRPYTVQKKGREYVSYVFQYRNAQGQRETITRSDFNEAVRKAIEVAAAANAGRLDGLTLHNEDKRAYLAATELLKPFGIPLEIAVADYTQATRLLRGHSLTEAARYFAANNLPFDSGKTVPEVIRELIALKKEKKRSEVYIIDLERRLGVFADFCPGPISDVTTELIERFLRSLGLSPRSENNYRLAVGTMLRFAKKRGYLPRTHPGISEVEKVEETPQEEHILTPEQMAILLAKANRTIKPFLLLGGFAGIRHAELMRLDWSEIDLKQGFITIKAAKAKTKLRRLVPVADNLRAWLEPLIEERGPVVTVHSLCKPIQRLSRKAKVPWHSNILHNTYISCRVALTGDPQRVAYECGNSPRMIQTNYLRLVTPDVANRYFDIVPATPPNVLRLPAKCESA